MFDQSLPNFVGDTDIDSDKAHLISFHHQSKLSDKIIKLVTYQ